MVRNIVWTYVYHKPTQLCLFCDYGESYECPGCFPVQLLKCSDRGRRGKDNLVESELKTCVERRSIWDENLLKKKKKTRFPHRMHVWVCACVYVCGCLLLSTRILGRHHACSASMWVLGLEPWVLTLAQQVPDPLSSRGPVFSELIFESRVCVWMSLNL